MPRADGDNCVLTWDEWDELNTKLALAWLDVGRMQAALEQLLGWDQLTPCCPEGAPFHNGHNPDIRWARKLITEALGRD